jgi:hypothetical protein
MIQDPCHSLCNNRAPELFRMVEEGMRIKPKSLIKSLKTDHFPVAIR